MVVVVLVVAPPRGITLGLLESRSRSAPLETPPATPLDEQPPPLLGVVNDAQRRRSFRHRCDRLLFHTAKSAPKTKTKHPQHPINNTNKSSQEMEKNPSSIGRP